MIPEPILDQIKIKSDPNDPILKVELNSVKPCEDCGVVQKNRTTRIVWQQWRSRPFWYETCWNCKLVRIPNKTEFMSRNQLDQSLKR